MQQQYIKLLQELTTGRVQISRVIWETSTSGYQTQHEYFTLCPELIPTQHHQQIDDQVMDEETRSIKVYDCVGKHLEVIILDHIVKSTFHGHDQTVADADGDCCDTIKGVNLEVTEELCDRLCGEIDELNCGCDDTIDRHMCHDELKKNGYTGVQIQKMFKFKLNSVDVRDALDTNKPNDQLKESDMEIARECYMDYIREHRKPMFEELDQLEQETRDAGGSEDDLADIDTIKQMFRDIPQDTNMSECDTLEKLFEFWPSLMLPKPVAHNITSDTPYADDTDDEEFDDMMKAKLEHAEQLAQMQLLSLAKRCTKQELRAFYLEIKDLDDIHVDYKKIIASLI